MPQAAAPIFPLRDAWLPLVPLLPLGLSAVLFSWLLDPLEQLVFLHFDPGHFVPRPQREYVHLGDMLSYFSLAAFHVLLCLAVVVTFVIWLRRLPRRQALGGVVFLGLGLLLVVAVSLFFQNQASEQVLTQLGYKAICQVIAAAELPTRLVLPGQCFHVDDISRLTLMAWVPTFSGMAAVCLAAAFAYANGRGLPPRSDDDPAWREAIAGRIKALQRSVYLLSAVLVSSTLIAAFAAPALRLLGAAYGAEKAAGDGGELQSWLHDHVFQSLRRQLATVLSLLAPLLVGPLSSLLSSVSGL